MNENKDPQKSNSDVIIIKKDTLKGIIAIVLFVIIISSVIWLCLYIGKRYDKNDNGGRVNFWSAVTKDPPAVKIIESDDPTKIIVDVECKTEYRYIIVAISIFDDPPAWILDGRIGYHLIAIENCKPNKNNQIEYYMNAEEILTAGYVKCEVFSYY